MNEQNNPLIAKGTEHTEEFDHRKQDELLKDELIQGYCDRLVAKDSCVLNDEIKSILEDFLAKVKQRYEQKRLDRPELREEINAVMCAYGDDVKEANCSGCINFKKGQCENPKTKELLALIPDIEEAKKQEDR